MSAETPRKSHDGFTQVKLICGLIGRIGHEIFQRSEDLLCERFGRTDAQSPLFPFDLTDYYEKQMGKDLGRMFLSFQELISPTRLSAIKKETIDLEARLKREWETEVRVINLDPGYLSASALIMATTKDFAHRVPLESGVYAHLECLFSRNGIRTLDWTYPDFRTPRYRDFLMKARRIYLGQIQAE